MRFTLCAEDFRKIRVFRPHCPTQTGTLNCVQPRCSAYYAWRDANNREKHRENRTHAQQHRTRHRIFGQFVPGIAPCHRRLAPAVRRYAAGHSGAGGKLVTEILFAGGRCASGRNQGGQGCGHPYLRPPALARAGCLHITLHAKFRKDNAQFGSPGSRYCLVGDGIKKRNP